MSLTAARWIVMGSIILLTVVLLPVVPLCLRKRLDPFYQCKETLRTGPQRSTEIDPLLNPVLLSQYEVEACDTMRRDYRYLAGRLRLHVKQVGQESDRSASRVRYIRDQYLDDTVRGTHASLKEMGWMRASDDKWWSKYAIAYKELADEFDRINAVMGRRCLTPNIVLYASTGRIYRLAVIASELYLRLGGKAGDLQGWD
jgi:hypothetical protein